MKKIDANIRTKKGYKSRLNVSYLLPETESESFDMAFRGSNDYFCLEKLIEEEKNCVISFLKSFGLPNDIEKNYKIEIKDNGRCIYIDDIFHEKAKVKPTEKHKKHGSGNSIGSGSLDFIINQFFSHIAGARQAGNAIFHLRLLEGAISKKDFDRCAFHSLRIGQFLRGILLAEVEDYIHSEEGRRSKTESVDKYLYSRWKQLSEEKFSLNTISLIVAEELNENKALKSLADSTIRKKIQGKNLQQLKDKCQEVK